MHSKILLKVEIHVQLIVQLDARACQGKDRKLCTELSKNSEILICSILNKGDNYYINRIFQLILIQLLF